MPRKTDDDKPLGFWKRRKFKKVLKGMEKRLGKLTTKQIKSGKIG